MPNAKFNILIVDDDIETLKMISKVFEARGRGVFCSPTGASAMAIIEKEKVDLVLLDIKLPDKSGLDVLKEIKSKYPSLSVVVVTGFGYEDELVNKALQLGASGYVSKGVPVRELVEVVNNVIAKANV